ncbi:Transcription factor AP-4 [Trachymyrmex septentrionalis]|uniref:Transcription factor AP-4 n=1 Tax=Trachymyrmex septentrionalis TaxID=34720 RepID=A0A195FLZ4_9HYME|nr:Transcription factor AP-4 [Trachymyrmex septentrionalis]
MGRANPDHGQRSTTISTRVHCFLRHRGCVCVCVCRETLNPLTHVMRRPIGNRRVFFSCARVERALCGYPANERADVTTANHPASKPPASVETVDDGSVTTSVTVAEVADTQERQPQQRQQPPQSKGNVGVGRRVASQNVALSNGNGISNVGRVASRSHMEQEKRMRREIANSNERRRMQSINAGFQSLRTLLPHHEGEKLSKTVSAVGHEYTTDPRKSLPANLFPTALCHLCEVRLSETGISEALRRCVPKHRKLVNFQRTSPFSSHLPASSRAGNLATGEARLGEKLLAVFIERPSLRGEATPGSTVGV